MKFGFRKPSFKKSIAARTIGRAKRDLMKSIIPGYGTRNTSIVRPVKKAYNKLYHQTTFGINDVVNVKKSSTKQTQLSTAKENNSKEIDAYIVVEKKSNDPLYSYYKSIVNEINKLKKQNNILTFFIYLDGIFEFIKSLQNFENQYGFNHNLSNELLLFMNNNRFRIINDFINRSYENLKIKIPNYKSDSTKKKKIQEYLLGFKKYEKELTNDQMLKIEEYYNKLLNLL